MKARNEVYALMNEFASLKTPAQEAGFKKRMDALLNSKTREERAEFNEALLKGARMAMAQADEIIEKCERKNILQDIRR